MLNFFPINIFIGAVLGFLSGLGVGGGSLLLLWLTMVVGTDPASARLINLMFFLPAGFIACQVRRKKNELKIKPLLPAMISGSAAAAFCSVIRNHMDLQILQKLFGIMLLAAGIKEFFYRPRKER